MIQLTDFKKSIGLLLIFLKKRTIGRITLLNYWIFCGRHFFYCGMKINTSERVIPCLPAVFDPYWLDPLPCSTCKAWFHFGS